MFFPSFRNYANFPFPESPVKPEPQPVFTSFSSTPSSTEPTPQPPVRILSVPVPPSTGSGYISASTAPRANVERKIPDRYIGVTEGPKTTSTQKRYDFKQKLAQLSVEKEQQQQQHLQLQQQSHQSLKAGQEEVAAPAAHNEPSSKATSEQPQQQLKQEVVSSSQPLQTPSHQSFVAADLNQPPPAQAYRSQDVRRQYPQAMSVDSSESSDWGRRIDPEYGAGQRQPPPHPQSNYSAPNDYAHAAPMSLHSFGHAGTGGHGSAGHGSAGHPGSAGHNGPPTAQHGSMKREDYESHWEDLNPYQRWGVPDNQRRPAQNYGDENEDWYDNGNQNGWNHFPDNPTHARYENGGGYREQQPSQRSRPTSNSYDDYNEVYRTDYQRTKKRSENGEDRFHVDQQYGRQQPPSQQQQHMGFRMLKRNDEKSAEYFGNKPGRHEDDSTSTLSQLTRFGRANKPMTQQPAPDLSQKFNKAPGSGKPYQKEPTPVVEKRDPPENVWKKRAEEQQLKEQEERNTWQNVSKSYNEQFLYLRKRT